MSISVNDNFNLTTNNVRSCVGYAAMAKGEALQPWNFERRELTPEDVAFRVLFCGVCHTDLSAVRKGLLAPQFPLVPGHEMVGEVTAVGRGVKRFRVGDRVVMGTLTDSCRVCDPCRNHEEVYCVEYPTSTYGGTDRHDGSMTQGGYASEYVSAERFLYAFPEGLDPAGVAPLLCAGVTTFSPLRHWGIGPGQAVGVVGIGGLGHLGVKFARALGAHVVAFTTSEKKKQAAFDLGAHEVVASTDPAQMAAMTRRLDFILDTVSGPHDLSAYLLTLKLNGTLCSLGLSGEPLQIDALALMTGRRRLASSGSGGTHITQEMLDFCQAQGIVADVETIRMDQIEEGFDRLERGDVHYRLVIDMATL